MLLEPAPLNARAFAAFGQIIEVPADGGRTINGGTAIRHSRLATVDTSTCEGEAVISLFVAQARSLPLDLQELERHPLGSQAFMPLDGEPYLIVVAPGNEDGSPGLPQAFIARPDQGINLHRGVWHHPLLALHQTCRFLVVDRDGPGDNLEVVPLNSGRYQIDLPPAA